MPVSSIAARVFLTAAVVVGLVGGVLASPASAGGNFFAVDVIVVGPVPAGTTFTIDVSCPGNATSAASFTFDSAGVAIGGSGVSISAFPTTCTATQSQNGGAAAVTSVCSPSGTIVCGTDHSATFAISSPANAFVAFTDGFLPPLTVNPPSGMPGEQFTVSSTGCTKALFGGSASTASTVEVTAGFAPPIVMNLGTAPTTGAWSTVFTVPSNATGGPIAVSATCDDPAPYPTSSFTVLAAAAPVVANADFTG